MKIGNPFNHRIFYPKNDWVYVRIVNKKSGNHLCELFKCYIANRD